MVFTAMSVTAVFASDNLNDRSNIKSMFDSMRDWARQAQSTGEISEQEAKEWNSHFEVMEKYHEKNGFAGHCGISDNKEANQKKDIPDSKISNTIRSL